MKPPPFEYHAPATVEEALQLLAGGNGTYALAGGQSLVQLMKFRQVRPSALVDLNGVPGLDVLEEREGELRVGALVRQQRLLEDDLIGTSWPLLREAAKFVGYKETRRRGTVGGSLAFAAPWAELTAAAVALDAVIDVRSLSGERTIPARSFFRGPNTTALEPALVDGRADDDDRASGDAVPVHAGGHQGRRRGRADADSGDPQRGDRRRARALRRARHVASNHRRADRRVGLFALSD